MNQLDLVISDALMIDGSLATTPTLTDVGVRGGIIEEVGDLSDRARSSTLDAGGRVLTPGFIDTHTHVEMTALGGDDRGAAVAQGITTTLIGADGFGWVGLDPANRRRWWEETSAIYGPIPSKTPDWPTPSDFLLDIRRGSATDVVAMIPHNNLRASVMGASPAKPDASQMTQMHSLVDDWMQAGAAGLATGLDYLPGRFAGTDEIIELNERVAESGGVYASHLRTLDLGRQGAWREAHEIGRRSGTPVRIAHERLDEEGLSLLNEVSASWDVTVDSYLYPAGCTSLAFHVPPELLLDGVMHLVGRLRADTDLATELAETLDPKLDGGPGKHVIVAGTGSGRFEGRTIESIAAERGVSAGRVGVELLIEEMPSAVLIYAWQDADSSWDEVMKTTLNDPRTLIASDGIYFGTHAHPRGFGAFPRVLGQLCRDKGLVSLVDAVHKMTAKPAEAYGLSDRGRIEPGLRADLVLFDPEVIAGADDFANPRTPPRGIEMTMVGGVVTRKEQV